MQKSENINEQLSDLILTCTNALRDLLYLRD